MFCDNCEKMVDNSDTSTYWCCRSQQCKAYALCEPCFEKYFTKEVANRDKKGLTFHIKEGERGGDKLPVASDAFTCVLCPVRGHLLIYSIGNFYKLLGDENKVRRMCQYCREELTD